MNDDQFKIINDQFVKINKRLDSVNKRFEEDDDQFTRLYSYMEKRFDEIRRELDGKASQKSVDTFLNAIHP